MRKLFTSNPIVTETSAVVVNRYVFLKKARVMNRDTILDGEPQEQGCNDDAVLRRCVARRYPDEYTRDMPTVGRLWVQKTAIQMERATAPLGRHP